MHQIELQAGAEQEDTRTRFQRLGKEQTREGAKKKKRKQINKQTNKKKNPTHNSRSTSPPHYGFSVAYLPTRELSESICSLSTIYFPPENSQAVLV